MNSLKLLTNVLDSYTLPVQKGVAGSTIICMHVGLIPIVSYESSVDVDDFGIIIKDSSVEEIKAAIKEDFQSSC